MVRIEAKREAKLRLDHPQGELSPFHARDGHQAIQPHDLEGSELWKRITTDDASLQMPPRESIKQPLTYAQREMIARWIKQGATYEDFGPLFLHVLQTATDVENGQNGTAARLTQFVLRKLEMKSVSPQPPADKRTLIRRVTLDLTACRQRSKPSMISKRISRPTLMPSWSIACWLRHYGEHMARYWFKPRTLCDTMACIMIIIASCRSIAFGFYEPLMRTCLTTRFATNTSCR